MPRSVEALVELLDLDQVEPCHFRGRQPQTSRQRVFGGQVAGQALVAAGRTVDADRLVHSLHAYFLRPGDTSTPIEYDVELTRDGGSFSTRRVVAKQRDQTIFYMSASFHLDEEGFDHQDAPPAAPDPDDCPTLGAVLQRATGRSSADWAQEWAALDVRYVGDSRSGGSDGNQRPGADGTRDAGSPGAGVTPQGSTARACVWARIAGPLPTDPLLHRAALAYASDLTLLGASLIPHRIFIGDPRLRTASLDHAMWFHRPFRADEWLLYDQTSPSASGARGLSTGRLFSRAGALVASVAQEGLIRRVGPRSRRDAQGADR